MILAAQHLELHPTAFDTFLLLALVFGAFGCVGAGSTAAEDRNGVAVLWYALLLVLDLGLLGLEIAGLALAAS